jgi:AraC family transcriptional regulator
MKGGPFRLDQTPLGIGSKGAVLRTSDDLGWPNINVSVIVRKPDERPLVHQAVPDLWLAMSRFQTELTIETGERVWDLSASRSWMSVIAPKTPVVVNLRGNSVILHVFVRRAILAEVANELFERDVKSVEIVSSFGVEDFGLANLLRLLEEMLFEPAGDADLKAEYLARALAAHVLRKNTTVTHTGAAAVVPLTNRQVRLLKEYVRDNLSSKIVLKDLASLVNLSQTGLARRFKVSFRQSPHRYVMEVRVSRARELLEHSNRPIAEIAAVCGFVDRTHLGVVFKRSVGMTPSMYRRSMQE